MRKTDIYGGGRQLYSHQIAHVLSVKIRADELERLRDGDAIKKIKNIGGNDSYQLLICSNEMGLSECVEKLWE